MALEEALCINLTKHNLLGGLRFYENSRSIILGISDHCNKNIPEPTIEAFQLELGHFQSEFHKKKNPSLSIGRRASGGGTVYQDLNWNLNYSIFINLKEKKELYPIHESYRVLSNIVIQALNSSDINAVQAGKSDLSIRVEGKENLLKISGNAQFRKRDCLVHHGTLILSQNLIQKVKEILKHPPIEPEYRKGRSHEDFITSLPEHFSLKIFKDSLKQNLIDYLNSNGKQNLKSFYKDVFKGLPQLITEKYLNSEFIFSR